MVIGLMIMSLHVFSCTTFIISGKVTTDGKPILFKNRETDVMENSLVFFTDGKYEYIGLVNGNDTWDKMVWGGYNETGFAIINAAGYTNNIGDTSAFKDQEGVIMKLALQNCRTLADFENLLDRLEKPMGLDSNFGVIDAYGGAAYYETGNYAYKKYDANDSLVAPDGIIIRTNYSFRANKTKGYGYCRYNTASQALSKALAGNKFDPHYLFENISRNLSHSLTKTDLREDIPKYRDTVDYRFYIDYITRASTSSAVLIKGAKSPEKAMETMMWTILGFPLTSVAIPVWIQGGRDLPVAVAMNDSLRSPLCTAALKLKEECFPVIYPEGKKYINLSVVINRQGTGIMQLLQPVEKEIFEKAEHVIEAISRSGNAEDEIKKYYLWLDRFLSEAFKDKLNITLFED